MIARHATPRPRGFTLVELVLSLGIMSLVLVGLSSAIIVASHALPATTSVSQQRAQAAAAMESLGADLEFATSITELSANAITVTVADRGHGAAGDETIRWEWAGGALTRQYNGAMATTFATGVTAFALSEEVATDIVTSAPKVLMVVNNATSPSTEDQARIDKLTAWTFPVTLISAGSSQAQLDAAIAQCDVMYITAGTYSLTLGMRLHNPSVGIVNENDWVYGAVGISSLAVGVSHTLVVVSDNSHEILKGMANGNVVLVKTGVQHLHETSGTVAAGAAVLASSAVTGAPALVVLSRGGKQSNDAYARARRVALPWGGALLTPFAFDVLTADALTILKRSLVWAAAPPVHHTVHAKLSIGTGVSAETSVELLNRPRVTRP